MVGAIEGLTATLGDTSDLFAMARDENDDDTLEALEADSLKVQEGVEALEFRRMFSNPADPSPCFLEIQAGAGGTEACDWAAMLLRQYLRYCERRGFTTTLLEESEGDVAGIKGATLKVEGEYAYGYLRTERAFTGWCASRRSIPAAGDTRRSPRFMSTPRSMIRSSRHQPG